MKAEIMPHALDRAPLSLIIDDSTVLLNLNYFWMRDRCAATGERMRWEDVPVVHPTSFVREFAQFCLDSGVRGKFSVVPYPAAVGRVDQDLPIVTRTQQDEWLDMCREVIMPAFDITPEMLTHTVVVDPHTLVPTSDDAWEQFDWETLPVEQPERVFDYIVQACRILCNVGLEPTGVTSPGGFGGRTLEFYARITGEAVRSVTGKATPFFFKRVDTDGSVATPVWFGDPEAGTAVGEIIASTDDRTGSWTGYGRVDADYYISEDLASGRLVECIDHGWPGVLCSHWQGFYGMHNDDRKGFAALQTVVTRLAERDPYGERTRWRTCSEITDYACMCALATVSATESSVKLDLPVHCPGLTLRLTGVAARSVEVGGRPLKEASCRREFQAGTFLPTEAGILVAINPEASSVELTVTA